jgi:hypothetical protein
MISEKFSTNPESFIKFGRGHRIDLATSHGNTHILTETKIVYIVDIENNKSQYTLLLVY